MKKMINARQFLSYKRLDLMAKYTYVEHKLKGYSMDWATELYSKHIEAFTDGLCQEPGSPEKNSLQIFLDTFDGLIEDISTNGFDPEKGLIPVSADGVLYNGAHRAAVCAYLNREVPCEILEDTACFDYFYFKKLHLADAYLDYMVTKYTQLFPEKCWVICLWPRACARKDLAEQADSLLDRLGLVAAKTIAMNADALRNLALQCCWEQVDTTAGKMRVYVVESPDADAVLKAKQQLCGLFGMEHIATYSSNPAETQMMMQMLFNGNSLDMLNRGCVDYDAELLEKIAAFQEALSESGQNPEDFILAASSVMGLYKLRKANGLGYLSLNGQEVCLPGADNHADRAHYYPDSVENLLRNPRKHLYIMGIKCITLDVLLAFKEKRGEKEDDSDAALIRRKQRETFTLRNVLHGQQVRLQIGIRNGKAAARVFLENHNITFFTKLWHWLRGRGFE